MIKWHSWPHKALFRKTNVPALIAFLVVVVGWIAAEKQARENYLHSQRASIVAQVAVLRADLEAAVNGPIQLVRGLIATIATEPDMDQARFAELASGLLNHQKSYHQPSLRNVAAAPGMIIQMMYPIEGNEQLIGLDYNLIRGQRNTALRARDLGDMVLAGPVDLVQGGQGFIARFPVYLQDADNGSTFWGIVSAVIYLEVLYANSGLDDDLPFSVTLTGQDGTGAEGARFYGPAVTPEDMPVVSQVQLPTGSWQIEALPHGGWHTTPPYIWTIRALLLLAAALILVPSIVMGHLMEARQQAIKALETANMALRRQMHDLEAARAAQAEAEVRLRQSQKLEAVGQLTGGVAHDFNNLLTVILGNSEVLEVELRDQHRLRDLAHMTSTAAERGAELVSRLLAFSRSQPLQPRVLNVAELICCTMEGLLRRTLSETIELEFHCADDPWQAEIDPNQLEAALLNIVLNARDAMPEGGRITIRIRNAELDEYAALHDPDLKAGEYVMIAVTDTGHGMAEDTLERVFEPFFTTKEVGKGSGLGLSMVYGFVMQSGGQVRVRSAPGKGSEVTLYFPRVVREEVRNEVETVSRKIARGNETILIVEDDEMVREHVRTSLSAMGYKVVEAENAEKALKILEHSTDIDLLFTDIVLPGGMNGRELADAAREKQAGLKVLFTSGYSEDAIVHHGRLDTGVELLSKPYRRNQLSEKIRKVLA